jgi:hypothetical protein
VFRCEMCVSHDHLKCPMPEQFRNGPQIHPAHSESTGKGMAVAMLGIFLNLGFFKGGREPSARSLEGIACAHGREDGVSSRPGLLAPMAARRRFSSGSDRNLTRPPPSVFFRMRAAEPHAA